MKIPIDIVSSWCENHAIGMSCRSYPDDENIFEKIKKAQRGNLKAYIIIEDELEEKLDKILEE